MPLASRYSRHLRLSSHAAAASGRSPKFSQRMGDRATSGGGDGTTASAFPSGPSAALTTPQSIGLFRGSHPNEQLNFHIQPGLPPKLKAELTHLIEVSTPSSPKCPLTPRTLFSSSLAVWWEDHKETRRCSWPVLRPDRPKLAPGGRVRCPRYLTPRTRTRHACAPFLRPLEHHRA